MVTKKFEGDDVLVAITPEEDKIRNEVYTSFLEVREIIINDAIDDKIFERAVMQILMFNAEDAGKPAEMRQPIILHINSVGGYVIQGMNLINVIKNSVTPVYGVCHMAYSMAAHILINCHKRYAFKNSSILLHDGENMVQATGSKAKDVMNWMERLEERLDNMIFEKTNISKEKYEEQRRNEWYMFGDEAKELGLVDFIIGEDIPLEQIL